MGPLKSKCILIYICLHTLPKGLHIFAIHTNAINVLYSLINTFLPTTLKTDSEILISVNSEQNVPISLVTS